MNSKRQITVELNNSLFCKNKIINIPNHEKNFVKLIYNLKYTPWLGFQFGHKIASRFDGKYYQKCCTKYAY